MKSIGNIVCSNLNVRMSSCFNKCLSINEIDKSLPTLIIGLDYARGVIDGFDILVKEYANGMIWWTFSKSEKRDENIEDILRFKNYCIHRIIGDVEYELFDVISADYSASKQMLSLLGDSSLKYWYDDRDRFVFVYSLKVGTVFGISLDTCEYCGIAKQKVLGLLEKGKNMQRVLDFEVIPEDISKMLQYSEVDKMVLFDFFS